MRGLDQDIEIRFPGCSSKTMNGRAIIAMLGSPLFLGYVLAVVLIFGMIDYPQQPAVTLTPSIFISLVTGALSYVGLHLASVAVVIWLTPPNKDVIYHSIIGFVISGLPSVTLAVVLGEAIGAFPMVPYPEKFTVIALRTTQVLVFEWVFHAFVLAALINTASKKRKIKFGDNILAADDLIYAQALEHHVKLVTKTGEHVERSRLKDVIQILSDVQGIQPHRSYWVPKHAILNAEIDVQSVSIYTENTSIPVAVTRRKKVEQWLVDNHIQISQRF